MGFPHKALFKIWEGNLAQTPFPPNISPSGGGKFKGKVPISFNLFPQFKQKAQFWGNFGGHLLGKTPLGPFLLIWGFPQFNFPLWAKISFPFHLGTSPGAPSFFPNSFHFFKGVVPTKGKTSHSQSSFPPLILQGFFSNLGYPFTNWGFPFKTLSKGSLIRTLGGLRRPN